uniref:Uncharacterized protein n=1 Tax=Oryza punctata TaxID=4537 RepID=A0A0E0K419_ORYPU
MEATILAPHQVAILALPAAKVEAAAAAAPGWVAANGVSSISKDGAQDHGVELEWARSYGSLIGSSCRQIPICWHISAPGHCCSTSSAFKEQIR